MSDHRYFDRITRADVRVFFLIAIAIGAFLLDAWGNGQNRSHLEHANPSTEVECK